MAATEADKRTEDDSGATAGAGDLRQPYLFRVIDCNRPLVPSSRHALEGVNVVELGRGERGAARGDVLRIQESDTRISTAHARIRRVPGRWLLEDMGSRNGTLLNGEPVRVGALNDGDLIELGRTFFMFCDGVSARADDPLDLVVDAAAAPPGMVTLSPALAQSWRALATITRSMVTVTIHGETGTGKELIARGVHELSGRPGPFIAVNCGAIPASLIESELFGARKGAYSGAVDDRPGFVRSADRGTLFLDEIGDLPMSIQAAFLRVLQERAVVPVGQARPVPVDLRVVCASHKRLEELVARGAFRDDLVARLTGFEVELPPLRERLHDVGIILAALIARLSPAPDRVTFQPTAMRALLRYSWPRNVRQLERHLEAALVVAGDGPVELAHLGRLQVETAREEAPPDSPADAALRAEMTRLLVEHQGNVAAVARAAGKDRVQIRRWLKRLRIDAATFKGG